MFDSPLFFYAPELNEDMPGQWRISEVQIINWGTLDGYQRFTVPRKGLLLTGESGSGKSTVIDAINSVLTRDVNLHFNVAASGGTGRKRDRNLVTYVRGVYGNQQAEDGTLKMLRLRGDTTRSGIALTFDNGLGEKVSAVRIFYIAGASNGSEDLKRRYYVVDDSVELLDIVNVVQNSNFARNLNTYFDQLDVASKAFDKSPDFLAYLYRRIGIQEEQAALLLQKTISTKTVENVDDLMRDFMLSYPKTFDIAENAADSFANLRNAHQEVLEAERQIKHLEPLDKVHKVYVDASNNYDYLQNLKEFIDPYHYELTQALAESLRTDANNELVRVLSKIEKNQQEQAKLREEISTLQAQIDEQGGRRLQELKSELKFHDSRKESVQSNLKRIKPALDLLDQKEIRSLQIFTSLQQKAEEKKAETNAAANETNNAWAELKADQTRLQQETTTLTKEINSLSQRNSSIPYDLEQLRQNMADDLGINADVFPYIAELIDIEDKSWRGALERLLSNLAKTLLVPQQYADQVAKYVDTHKLKNSQGAGMRLVWHRVPSTFSCDDWDFEDNSSLAKLKIADHKLADWVKDQLLRRADFVCVESPEELAAYDYALTIRGQIKRKHEHTKDDRQNIHDSSTWICGTSNKERLKALQEMHRENLLKAQEIEVQLKQLTNKRQLFERQANQLDELISTDWKSVDLISIKDSLKSIQGQIDQLESPDSDLAKLTQQLNHQQAELNNVINAGNALYGRKGAIEDRIEEHSGKIKECQLNLAEHPKAAELSDKERKVLAKYCEHNFNIGSYDTLANVIRSGLRQIEKDVLTQSELKTNSENKICKIEEDFNKEWSRIGANLLPTLKGVADYLRVLNELKRNNLPRFKKKFRDLLSEVTSRNLSVLRTELDNSFIEVKARVDEINNSLSKTPFISRDNTYIKLEIKDVRTLEAKNFAKDLRDITQLALGRSDESDAETEIRFKKAEKFISRLNSSDEARWRDEVLDTRKHVGFQIIAYNGATNEQVDAYAGSGGRSGGQSQKLVAFCLAAALRYRLADQGSYEPRYGSILLDEAFDKADADFTRDALKVFKEFGFQLILAVPNSKIQVLEEFVDGIYMSRLSDDHKTIWKSIPFQTKQMKESAE